MPSLRPIILSVLCIACLTAAAQANGNVYVCRFWHCHQPLYWPEWNSNGSQTSRGQFAWDSIVLKPGQNYGGLSPKQHPENNLTDIFGLDDRRTSYQSGPRNSLTTFNSAGGFAISYSGSLIDNVRQLGSLGQLGYGSGWNSGYREARGWKTPAGSTRMDLVGFTYHHSLAPLLPKSVFRKELQIFKQAWWKAWGGNGDLSDHSKGFFPTEMGYSRDLIDVLVEEKYEWVIVGSHHISRTCPTYNTKANPEGSYNIFSSPPNKADQLGPSPTDGWWYGEPNPGNAAWNVSPFAYQLHRVKYVNPETGAEKTMIAVPSDDVLSYRYGYANEGIGKIGQFISPFATDPARPVMVMPSTDGDNAWGGGSSSWNEATPQLFNGAASAGYKPSTPQDFVNAHGASAPMTHIEDGAWIFPEMCYGSPNFMKWIEPPVATVANRGVTTVPGTQIDMETPGFALKFYSYAPLMAGANWCETAEQILRDEGGSVQAWKIQDPYNNLGNGQWTGANEVEQAWHIYLMGLDSGFNYYGGLGNDDEMKPGLATRRAVEKLTPWMTTSRRNNDRTGPTVLKPQRFPYNPGWYTFGWFNQQPQIPNNTFLKRMNSEFYIWTHAYDLNGIPADNVKLKIRVDADGTNPLNGNQNETYAGGSEVGQWVTITMNKRELPKTREALNAAAANSQIDYFLPVQADAVADYYFAKITNDNLPNFRSKLLDYYIEATDSKGNVSKSDIQHVWVDDYSGASNSGGGGGTSSAVTINPTNPVAGQPLTVTYNPAGRALASATSVNIHHGYNQNISANWTALPGLAMSKTNGTNWTFTYTLPSNATTIALVFNNGTGTWDNNGGGNWNFNVTTNPITQAPDVPTGLAAVATNSTTVSVSWTNSARAASYKLFRDDAQIAAPTDTVYVDTGRTPETTYTYKVRAVNAIGESADAAPVSVTTPFAALGGTEILVLDPAGTPAVSSNTYIFKGRAGSSLTNGLTWTNPANGTGGTIPFPGGNVANGWNWTNQIALADGTNNVRFDGVYPTSGTSTYTDSAASYNTWTQGSGAGAGFGGWFFNHSVSGASNFIATTANNPNMNLGAGVTKGFGLWANGANSAKASRALVSPMKSGDSLSIRFDNNWITTGKDVGFELRDPNGGVRFKFYFVGGDNTYRITDAATGRDSGLAYTALGLNLKLTQTGSNTYSLDTGSSVITNTLGNGSAITWIEFFNNGTGTGADYDVFFGEMSHTIAGTGSGTATTTALVTRTSEGVTDGIPDSWWSQYGITDRVASNDPDGDGFTNAQEYSLGTDPTDRASVFRITSVNNSGGTSTVEWSSVSGKKYRLQAKAALSDSWADVGSEVLASGASSSATHPASSQHFYRVRLVSP
jgi:hypothetical protein